MSGGYPTLEEVEQASREQLCRWWRFLRSARDEKEESVQTAIYHRFRSSGGFTPEISKAIGWSQPSDF